MEPTVITSLSLTQPDDWHLHLRDGDVLRDMVRWSAAQFARAVVMPNLKPPVATVAGALAYRDRIRGAVPAGRSFEPLMTLYMSEALTASEVVRAKEAGVVGVKLYPAGATTNSETGVQSLRGIYPVLEAMQRIDLPLLIHGEVVDTTVDIFDREAAFLERHLIPLRRDFPELRVVLEHITTREAAQYIAQADRRTAATITAHHLIYNRNAMLVGGMRPHYYCLPVLKREEHRLALLRAATSGSPRFFLGTDSAPHATALKEHACACAGCFTAPLALELYAQAFDAAGALSMLEGFASFHGPDFYGLPRNAGKITLVREPWQVPAQLPMGQTHISPLCGGETLSWRCAESVRCS